MGGAKAGMLDLRSGLSVSLQDAEECDDETLVMLSKGVAYTLATGTEPLVKKLYMQAREPLSLALSLSLCLSLSLTLKVYMQALLHVPDHIGGKARALPPIHVLVVREPLKRGERERERERERALHLGQWKTPARCTRVVLGAYSPHTLI
jgi:hypothetical protein